MTETTINFDALEREQHALLEDLQAERAALALDAVTDDSKRAELDDVESQMRAVQRELERIAAARREYADREAARAAEEARKRRSDLIQQVLDLNEPRRLQARKLDRALRAFIKELVAYRDLGLQQKDLLRDAGGLDGLANQASVDPAHVEGALAAAIGTQGQGDRDLWRMWSDLSPEAVTHDRRRSFAESCTALEPEMDGVSS